MMKWFILSSVVYMIAGPSWCGGVVGDGTLPAPVSVGILDLDPDSLDSLLLQRMENELGERWVAAEGAQFVLRAERMSGWRYDPSKLPVSLSLALARGWREGGNLRKAADCYRVVLARQPGNREAAVGQILTLARLLDDPRNLLDEVELALMRQPADVELRVAQADIQRRLGQKDRAMIACNEILTDHPDFREARVLKARLLVELAGSVSTRPGLFEEALRLSENASEIRAEYVKALAGERRAEEALAQYELLPDIFPVPPDVLKAVARSYQDLNRYEDAAIFYSLALRKQSSDPSLQDVSVADVKDRVRRDLSEREIRSPERVVPADRS